LLETWGIVLENVRIDAVLPGPGLAQKSKVRRPTNDGHTTILRRQNGLAAISTRTGSGITNQESTGGGADSLGFL
jgi:hypothetical protein